MISTKKHYEIQTERIRLVPYRRSLVQEYHNWFQADPELLYLTGSQPLSLQEQYQNQKSWIQDPKKYTFLICTKEDRMIGDVNLFFSTWIEPHQAQINIMIALKEERGKGYARQALRIIEAFAIVYYKRTQINAKIKDDNAASMQLFSTSGYTLINHSDHFKQNQYVKVLDKELSFYEEQLEGRIKQIPNQTALYQ